MAAPLRGKTVENRAWLKLSAILGPILLKIRHGGIDSV
jgi:hypothetical protein